MWRKEDEVVDNNNNNNINDDDDEDDVECPITLELISSLPYPPYVLQGNKFDGVALASFIVSRCCFQNPLTRQDLTFEDCRRLDSYLEEHCYHSTHDSTAKAAEATTSAVIQDPRYLPSSRKISVAEAFRLNQSVQVAGRRRLHGDRNNIGNNARGQQLQNTSAADADRMQVLRNTATVALAGLFVWHEHNTVRTTATHREASLDWTDNSSGIGSSSNVEHNDLLDWGFDLHRQVEDTSTMMAQQDDTGDGGWFDIVDDDDAINVGSRRDQYDRVQRAFPPLINSSNTGDSYYRPPAVPSSDNNQGQDQHLIECVRDISRQEEERRREHAIRLEMARQKILQDALIAREERRRRRRQQLQQGLVEFEKKKLEEQEIERIRDEIASWKEDQWEKLRLISESKQQQQQQQQKQEEEGARQKREQDMNDEGNKEENAIITEDDNDLIEAARKAQQEERKRAKAKEKKKRAKEKKKKEKEEKRIAEEELQRQQEIEAKKAAAALKCSACGNGILDCGFEKYNQRYCSTKCARTAIPPAARRQQKHQPMKMATTTSFILCVLEMALILLLLQMSFEEQDHGPRPMLARRMWVMAFPSGLSYPRQRQPPRSQSLMTMSIMAKIKAPAIQINDFIGLETSPLIGGPSWLPVHCRVVLTVGEGGQGKKMKSEQQEREQDAGNEVQLVYDYIPQNATSTETLQKLVSFQPVQAQVRIFSRKVATLTSASSTSVSEIPMTKKLAELPTTSSLSPNKASCPPSMYEQRAEMFCREYQDKKLHLLYNNCWTFAFNLIKTMMTSMGEVN